MNKANFLALCYADIFSYPLTREELNRWQINLSPTKKIAVEEKNGWYFLKGRKSLVSLRQKRKKISEKKMLFAQKVSRYLQFLPGIKMIALTGALAMQNSDDQDDIDFLIITSRHRVWLVRFFCTVLLEIFGLRRKPGAKKFAGKICLNMYLDENHLGLPKKERNLYTAHEILQTKSLINKNQTHERYLRVNSWVKKYLPNAFPKIGRIPKLPNTPSKIIDTIDDLFYRPQFWHMRKKITNEVIEHYRIFFHPNSTGQWVLEEFQKRVKKRYNISL